MKTINISSPHPNAWLRQFKGNETLWNGWRFIFNENDQSYDYLVAFDDLHAPIKLKCPVENTIHIATEPPTVCHYNLDFLKQFSTIITQDVTIDHPGRIFHQPGLTWFIGWQPHKGAAAASMSFEQLEQLFDTPKTKLISVIASNKSFTTDHAKRLDFALKLKEHFGNQIDFYGRGFVEMEDKIDALRDYRFNVVLENANINHYFSEKLSDCFISGAYPIYYGCPNLDEYFPKESFARININDFEYSVQIIKKAIEENYDQRYRKELFSARNLVMHEHNLYPMLINIISKIEQCSNEKTYAPLSYGGKLLPFSSPAFIEHFPDRKNGTDNSINRRLGNIAKMAVSKVMRRLGLGKGDK
jgi:hypothetical protein